MNALAQRIMQIVDIHSHKCNNPISLKEITESLGNNVYTKDVVKYSIRVLVGKGYLRKSVVRSKTVSYVQLRSVSEYGEKSK